MERGRNVFRFTLIALLSAVVTASSIPPYSLTPELRAELEAQLPTDNLVGRWRWGKGFSGNDETGHWHPTQGGVHTHEGLRVGAGCELGRSSGNPRCSRSDWTSANASWAAPLSAFNIRNVSLLVRLKFNSLNGTQGAVTMVYPTISAPMPRLIPFGIRFADTAECRAFVVSHKQQALVSMPPVGPGMENGLFNEVVLAASYDVFARKILFFVNGVQVGEELNVANSPQYGPELGVPPTMGFGSVVGQDGRLDATIFEVRLYNRALTARELRYDWNQLLTNKSAPGSVPLPLNLTYWHYAEPNQRQVAYDPSSNVAYVASAFFDAIYTLSPLRRSFDKDGGVFTRDVFYGDCSILAYSEEDFVVPAQMTVGLYCGPINVDCGNPKRQKSFLKGETVRCNPAAFGSAADPCPDSIARCMGVVKAGAGLLSPIGLLPWRLRNEHDARRNPSNPDSSVKALVILSAFSYRKISILPIVPGSVLRGGQPLNGLTELMDLSSVTQPGATLRMAAYHIPEGTQKYHMFLGTTTDGCLGEVVLSDGKNILSSLTATTNFGTCDRPAADVAQITPGPQATARMAPVWAVAIVSDGSAALVCMVVGGSIPVLGRIVGVLGPSEDRFLNLISAPEMTGVGFVLNTISPSSWNEFILYYGGTNGVTYSLRYSQRLRVNHVSARFQEGNAALASGTLTTHGYLIIAHNEGVDTACCALERFPVVRPRETVTWPLSRTLSLTGRSPSASASASTAPTSSLSLQVPKTPTTSASQAKSGSVHASQSSTVDRAVAPVKKSQSISLPARVSHATKTPTNPSRPRVTMTTSSALASPPPASSTVAPSQRTPQPSSAPLTPGPSTGRPKRSVTRTVELPPATPAQTPSPPAQPPATRAEKAVTSVIGGNPRAAQAVAVVASSAGPAAAAVANPAAASNAARVASIAGIADCVFSLDTSLDPSPFEHPIQVKIGSSPSALLAGSVLMTFAALLLPCACILVVLSKVISPASASTGLKRLLRFWSILSTMMAGYFVPQVFGATTTLLCHPDSGDAASITIGVLSLLASLALCGVLIYVLLVPFTDHVRVVHLSDAASGAHGIEFKDALPEESKERDDSSRSDSSSSNCSSDDSEDIATSKRRHRSESFVAEKLTSTATATMPRPPYRLALLAFFDACRDPLRVPLRLYFCEDILVSSLMMIISSVKPREQGACVFVGAAMVAVAVGHVTYLVALRPYYTVVDAGFAVIHATVQLTMCVCGLTSIFNDDATVALGYLILVETVLFTIQTFLTIAFSIYNMKRKARMVADDAADRESPLLAIGTNGDNSSRSDRGRNRISASAKRARLVASRVTPSPRKVRKPKDKDEVLGLRCATCSHTILTCRCDRELECVESDEENEAQAAARRERERAMELFRASAPDSGVLHCAVCNTSRLRCRCSTDLEIPGVLEPWERRKLSAERAKAESETLIPPPPSEGALICPICSKSRLKCRCEEL